MCANTANTPEFLENFSKYPLQVSGHGYLKLAKITDDTRVVVVKPTTKKELQFYMDIGESFPIFRKKWIPINYYHKLQNFDEPYLIMECLTSDYIAPNIVDIKLGKRLYDDDADSAKREKMKDLSESTSSGNHGIRITGMLYYLNDEISRANKLSKQECKSLKSLEEIKRKLAYFFGLEDKKLKEKKIFNLREIIGHIQDLCTEFPCNLQLYGSSLIIVTESHLMPTNGPTIKLIDFSHSKLIKTDDTSHSNTNEILEALHTLLSLLINIDQQWSSGGKMLISRVD